eukprot:7176102-Ditylum_brightwellii.AAC.1
MQDKASKTKHQGATRNTMKSLENNKNDNWAAIDLLSDDSSSNYDDNSSSRKDYSSSDDNNGTQPGNHQKIQWEKKGTKTQIF